MKQVQKLEEYNPFFGSKYLTEEENRYLHNSEVILLHKLRKGSLESKIKGGK